MKPRESSKIGGKSISCTLSQESMSALSSLVVKTGQDGLALVEIGLSNLAARIKADKEKPSNGICRCCGQSIAKPKKKQPGASCVKKVFNLTARGLADMNFIMSIRGYKQTQAIEEAIKWILK